jgi:hypothetical protein
VFQVDVNVVQEPLNQYSAVTKTLLFSSSTTIILNGIFATFVGDIIVQLCVIFGAVLGIFEVSITKFIVSVFESFQAKSIALNSQE